MEALSQSKLQTHIMLCRAPLLQITTLTHHYQLDISQVPSLLRHLLLLFQLLRHQTTLESATSRTHSLFRKLPLRRTMDMNSTSSQFLAHPLNLSRTERNMRSTSNLFLGRLLNLLRTDMNMNNTSNLLPVHNPKLLLHGPNMNSTLRRFLVHRSQRNQLPLPPLCQARLLRLVSTMFLHPNNHHTRQRSLLHLTMHRILFLRYQRR